MGVPRTRAKVNDYRAFREAVSEYSIKMQIGARGSKIDPSWIAVDLYDDADIIDRRWDLHCLLKIM